MPRKLDRDTLVPIGAACAVAAMVVVAGWSLRGTYDQVVQNAADRITYSQMEWWIEELDEQNPTINVPKLPPHTR
jgi:hypothetical protein